MISAVSALVITESGLKAALPTSLPQISLRISSVSAASKPASRSIPAMRSVRSRRAPSASPSANLVPLVQRTTPGATRAAPI